ncbi:MAG: T9SS type A sorting domain-containing protein [Bacteroidetes bacterium]|nr:T9SS type A sorting domain-containing protein [Bacteroidota bacterium]
MKTKKPYNHLMKATKLVFFILALMTYTSSKAQYCTASLGGAGCGVGDQITGVEIVGTTLNNPNNTCTSVAGSTLTVFPATGNTTANLIQGLSYNLAITTSANNIISVWFDYNQDFLLDASEWTQVCTTSTPGGTTTISFTVPFTSTLGITGMRIRSRAVNNTNGANDACTNFGSGEAEDYTINIIPNTPCSGTPVAGTATAPTSICPNVNFSVTLAGSTQASGLTYQWESSANGTSWTAISGATNPSLTGNQTTATHYRCIVTCAASSDTSTSVLVGMNSFTNCGCTSSATNTADDDIGNVTFGSLNNGIGTPALGNSTSVNLFTDFTNLPPQTFMQGINYPISVTQINSSQFFYSCFLTAYIDYNHDGLYDINTELIFSGQTDASLGGNTLTGTVTIPLTSLPGLTGLRLILQENGSITQPSCGTYTYGETEDYIVNIQAAVPCTAPPTAGMAYANDSTVCPSVNYTLNLLGSSIASGLSYQWEKSSNGTTWAAISGATAINYQTSQTSDNYYRCIITCLGVADTSTVVFVATNSFTTCYCTSNATDPADSDIGNVSLGALNNGNPNPAINNTNATSTYTNYASVTAPVLLQGINYPISITQISQFNFNACNVKVYIDYDQNGIYDPSTEEVFSNQTTSNQGGNVVSGVITIPLTALNGLTGMRVVMVEGTFSTVTPCGTYFNGETEDYVVDIQTPLPCTTPPVAGTAVSSAPSVCPNAPFDLNLSGSANASGLTYQWQESINGTNWTDIVGATSILYSYAQVVATYYRCVVTCSGIQSNSTPILVGLNSFFSCYCTSGATSTGDDDIGNVTFGLLNNGVASPATQNPTSVNTYSDFTNLPPYSYIQTLTYPMSMTQINLNGFYVCSGAIFIDFDHDGTFDPSTESVLSGTTSAGNTTISGTLTIPLTASTGVTAMRVVLKEGANPAAQPCGTYTWGETEDYLINILAPNSCTVPFIAGFAKSNSNLVCASDIFTLSLDSLPPDTGFTFQWQQSFDSINWNNIAGATVQIYSGSQSFNSWYRCNVTCNGGTMESSVATKVMNKPVTQCDYCNSSISGNCSTDYFIDSLAIGGTTFNNANTGCAANAGFAYSKYPINGNTTTDLGRGNYYDLYVKTAGACNISVWLDYDQSGTFDANEWVQVSQATDSAVTATVPLVLPTGAQLGATGMRVRSRKAGNINLGADACTNYGSGETEDYYVNVVEAISTGKELSNDKNVRIYPNPASGFVTVEYRSEEAKSLQIKLMNPEGRVIYTESNDKFKGSYSHKLNVNDLARGIYFVQFISDKQVLTKKVILN